MCDTVCLGGSRRPLLTCCEQVCVERRIPEIQQGKGVIQDSLPYRLLPLSSQRVVMRSPAAPMPLGDGVRIAMIRDRLSRLLKARSLFACVEVLVTNLVSDLEGDPRLLGDQQVQVSNLIREDDERSSSESEDSSD